MSRRALLLLAGGVAFAIVATLNAAGYRYGVADQAFYVPAVLQHLDPTLFPRDGLLIGSQAKLLIFDELFAFVHRLAGLPLPVLFLLGYLATMAAMYGALIALGTLYFRSGWTVAALVAAGTMRHRITKTGANTLEGHFHPRMLAFAIGAFAIVAVLRRRPFAAIALVGAAALLHPTTAIYFAVWVGIALAIEEPRFRRPLAIAAIAAGVVAVLAIARGMVNIAPMDEAWIAAFVDKDYIFPTAWSLESWAVNLLYPVVIVGLFLARRRAGVALPREAGVVVGCLSLVAIFLLSLPLIAMRSAFVVQFQTSRVFWMADLLATVYAIWWIAEGPWRARVAPGSFVARRWGPALAIGLAIATTARGWYVWNVLHEERPFFTMDLSDDPWRDVSWWLRAKTPKDAQVLVDPGHAFRYGTSLRVSAERDVFLEEVKDAAMALYHRPTALRVVERREAVRNFDGLNADQIRGLASRYDLRYLVIERPLPFDEVYRNARFHVYRLAP